MEIVKKFASRKFVAALGAYVLVMLDGLGIATFSDDVLLVATAALVAEIGVQGLVDLRGK
jgi:hypothetical protein